MEARLLGEQASPAKRRLLTPLLCTEDAAQMTRGRGAREGERKSPFDFSSYPSEYLEAFFCVSKVTSAIISKHVTAVIHREFNKGQGVSQTQSMVSGMEPITGCTRKEKTAVDKRFSALRNK